MACAVHVGNHGIAMISWYESAEESDFLDDEDDDMDDHSSGGK